MKEILIKNGDRYIECEVDGLEIIVKFSDDKYYRKYALKTAEHAQMFKDAIRDMYHSCDDKNYAYDDIFEYLDTEECHAEYFDGRGCSYCDPRSEDEIYAYLAEADDKVWLMRSYDIANKKPAHIASTEAAERILKTYDDIPENGYDTWECGYWNGIMSALRWVMGSEKDCLDT